HRQALHAYLLGFAHPTTGKPLRFESPLPADISRMMDALKSP
ncbi:MAG: RNA pseudouridine synthase, partial [Xanthobacteraceae bacterium]